MAGWVMQMREQTWQSSVLDKAVFPLHARGLSKSKIGDALERFSRVVKVAVDLQAVRVRWGSPEDKVDFLSFAHECMLDAGIAALFGQSSGLQIEEIKRHFKALDNAMPLLATCIVPGPIQPYCTLGGIAAGAESRDALKGLLAEWVRSGGHTQLDERNVIYTVVTEMLKLGWDDNDIGSMLAISLWVSLANSPLAVCWTLVYLSQADPSLLSDLRKELNDLAGSPASTADLPLLTSCYYETLRLQASTYSVRWCTADVIIGQQTQVKAGERVACLTRASQMDEAIWGEDASVWDGRRFYDDPHAIDRSVGESKSSKIASVRAFGGGPSKCEGRALALASAKCVLASMLQLFEFAPVKPTLGCNGTLKMYETTSGSIHGPRVELGRPGMGVLPFAAGILAETRVRESSNIDRQMLSARIDGKNHDRRARSDSGFGHGQGDMVP